MKSLSKERGFTLVELLATVAIIAVVGLVLYSLLSFTIILGAKNAAINTAHQQARAAMVRMQQDLHSAVSTPYLVDGNGNQVTGTGAPAAGISFQKWFSGPHLFKSDAAAAQNQITIQITSGQATPVAGQRLIMPSHQIEDDITAVSGTASSLTLTLAHNLPVAVTGTSTYSIVCFITERCSYTVASGALGRQDSVASTLAVIGQNITTAAPFSTPTAAIGSLYSRFVAAINLSTADSHYTNRGFKSANICLNGQVPTKARLTTYQ